jgi:uncharacterized protein involved in exopolysaccharide biosynthesis
VSRLEDRKVFLESKISDLQKEIGTIEGQSVDSGDPARNLPAEIAARRKKIRELTLKYTSKYPTVLQLQREVDELAKKLESLRKSGPLQKDGLDEDPYLVEPEMRKAVHERQEMGRLREQVASLNLEISSLKKEREETRKSIDSIQNKVSRLPQREQEMISLTRDYDNLKKAYDDLLGKKLGARVSQRLEEGQKGETFEVVEPPDLPSIPTYPDRLKILGISILAAIAVGFGGAIGREMLDPTLKSPKEFKHYFELPVLASLPVIEWGEGDRMKINLRMVLLVGSCSILSTIVVFLFVYRENIQAALQITGGTG